jgi:hypothetical protein
VTANVRVISGKAEIASEQRYFEHFWPRSDCPYCVLSGRFYNRTCMKTILLALLLAAPVLAQTPDPKSIPVIDGALGPCTADFTITDTANKPIYLAKIKVHIAYGFMSAHKLDLEVSTNVDGKARFTGLPDRVKRGLFFDATESDRTGNAFDDPSKTCQAQFTVTLRKPTTPQQ